MPPRADALRNREQILAVAHEALTDDPAASLNSIAKRAGVGAGTLYRHFPTREELILALYEQEVLALADRVPATLARHEPREALEVWFLKLADYVRVKHGLGDALNSVAAQQVIAGTYAPVTRAVGELLAAAEAAGQVRPGLDPADILLLMGFLWRVAPDRAGRQQGRRILTTVLDGLAPC